MSNTRTGRGGRGRRAGGRGGYGGGGTFNAFCALIELAGRGGAGVVLPPLEMGGGGIAGGGGAGGGGLMTIGGGDLRHLPPEQLCGQTHRNMGHHHHSQTENLSGPQGAVTYSTSRSCSYVFEHNSTHSHIALLHQDIFIRDVKQLKPSRSWSWDSPQPRYWVRLGRQVGQEG